MSPHPAMIARLRNTLARPDTVLLVGSGLSCSAGLPNWEGLLRKVAKHVEICGYDPEPVKQKIEKGDFLLAASLAASRLNARQLGEVIRQACQSERSQPAEVHRTLVRLGPTCFVTTNYDQLIERAFDEYRPNQRIRIVTNRQTPDIADIVTTQARNFVFKYHGDAMDTESIILSQEHYRRLFADFRHAIEAVKTILTTRAVVIVGFSMNDPDFRSMQDTLVNTFAGHAGEHYAIMSDVSDLESAYWKQNYNVDIVSYANPDGKHGALLDLLKNLAPAQTPASGLA